MFPEYTDLIFRLKTSDRQFASLLEKHKELDRKLQDIEAGAAPATHAEIEVLKKKKLACKDQIYNRLRECSTPDTAAG